ncbi:MAG: MFS transporter [Rhodospirillales bacterium 20-64-7]|nr:MAG: MFS transporter [Rhodospirillales bacterium 20-64-7]HQT76449.1 MFS transporter [Rhodopila sp.]
MFRNRDVDSPYAWLRLGISILLSAIGCVGMWSVVVVLPAVQTTFHVDRAAASMPFTLTMIGFGVGGVVMGRLADRFGVMLPLLIGAVSLGVGYFLASLSHGLTEFSAAYLLIGLFGVAATYVPLIADVSHWFERRRGIAVALCASGNYIAGSFWPPLIETLNRAQGWRATHVTVAILCLTVMPLLALLLRGRPPVHTAERAAAAVAVNRRIDLPPGVLQTLLAIAGLACCVAMSMPQVHIVAYCSDLGYGAIRGAEMLSLMLGFGIISRIGSGFLADRLGGVATLAIGSAAQMLALILYMLSDGLTSLYVISALFGLFQGGLVPSYPIIIRESFPVQQAGTRVGIVIMMTLLGMALGGWLSGVIFDMTGSYRIAFANGVAWNALNLLIALYLLARSPFIVRRSATARHAGSAAE